MSAGLTPPSLSQVVESLRELNPSPVRVRRARCKPLPQKDALTGLIERLRSIVFPRCFGPQDHDAESLAFHLGAMIDQAYHELREQVHRGLCFSCPDNLTACRQCEEEAIEIADRFVASIPAVAERLHGDVRATFEGDPAATSEDEVIFCYPGVSATLCQRFAHVLYDLKAPVIARIFTEYAHGQTGIDIHPGASIGERFMIDHGTGVVIGETTVIGHNVRLYQGVTLGAKSFPLDAQGRPIKGIKRHPRIGDDVIIYSGATILGDIEIGSGSVIGGNVWLTDSVPPHSRVLQIRAQATLWAEGGGI